MLAGVNRKLGAGGGAQRLLTAEQQRDYFAKALRAVKKKGADPVYVAGMVGFNAPSVPVDEVVKAFMKASPVQPSALDALPEGRKGAEKHRVDEIRKAHRRGREDADRAKLPGDDELDRMSRVNAEVEKLAIRDEAQALRAQQRAQEGAVHDGYSDSASVIARIMENGGPQTRKPDAGGIRNDGVRLGYRVKTHALVGNPEAGKTLTLVAMACDELKSGGSVLHLDADDNGEEATFALYLSFGADPAALSDPSRFRYAEVRTAEGARRFVAEAAEWRPTFAIVDAVSPFMSLFGWDQNDNADYRLFHAEIPARLADAGASTWQVDHLNKAEGDSSRYASGAGQKLGAISGVQYMVSVVEQFVPGVGGAAALKIAKDRPGGVRAVSPSGKSPTAAVFRLDSRGGASTWEFWKGRDDDDRADEQHEADVAYVLALNPFPTSRARLQAALKASQGKGWATDRAQAALEEARRRRDSATTFPITEKE